MRRGWVVALLWLAVRSAAAEELVPEGEPLPVVEGVRWQPASNVHALASAGALVVTGSDDGLLRFWDAAGRETRRMSLGAPVLRLAASADGKVVAAALSTGVVLLVDPAAGRVLTRAELAGVATALAVAPDGARVLAATEDGAAVRFAADVAPAPYPGLEGAAVRAAVFSPDGAYLAAALADRTVKLLPSAATAEPRTLGPIDDEPTSIAADASGLALGTTAGRVALMELASGRTAATLDAHADSVGSVAFVGGGRLVATSSRSGAVRIFERASGRPLRSLKADESCCGAMAVAAGGAVVAGAAHDRAWRWDVATGEPLATLAGQVVEVSSVALSTDGAIVAIGGHDGVARVLDAATGREKARYTATHDRVVVALDPAATKAAVGDVDGMVRVVELGSGKELRRWRDHRAAVTSLAFSPDGQAVLSGSLDRTVRISPLAAGAKAAVATEMFGPVRAVAVSADGSTVACAGVGGARVWPVEKPAEMRRLPMEGEARSLALSVDGKRLLVGHQDGTARLIDTAAGSEVRRFKADGPVEGVAAQPDGKTWVVAGGKAVVTFDAATGAETGRMVAAGVTRFALSAAALAVVAPDGEVSLAAWPARALTARLRVGPYGSLAIIKDRVYRTDDGRFLLSEAEGGSLKPVLPPSPATPQLKAEVVGVELARDGVPGRIKLNVTATDAPAYWLDLVGTGPDGVSVVPAPRVAKLAAGSSKELTLRYATLPGAVMPRDASFAVELVHAGGIATKVVVPVHTPTPAIEVGASSVEGSGAATVAKVELVNTGDGASGPLTLEGRFVAAGENVGGGPLQQLEGLGAGERRFVLLAVPAEAMARKADLEVVVATTGLSPMRWSAPVPLHRRVNWLAWAGTFAGLVGVAVLVWFVRISRHPIVLQLAKSPEGLRAYDVAQYELVHAALTRARRLDSALAAARIPLANWNRLRSVMGPPVAVTSAFAEAIGAKLLAPVAGGAAFGLEMPQLALRFPARTAVAVVTGSTLEPGTAAAIGGDIHAGGQGPAVAIALDLTTSQQAGEVLQSVPRMSFVVLGRNQVRDLLLAEDGAAYLQAIVAAQRPRAELSPYVTSGGVEEDALFFGRERELRQITDRQLHNFIVVAPRQMGKSSLLKAVHRRLSSRPDVEVHHITLYEEDLPARIARQLGVKKPETPDDFIEAVAGSRRKPRVWLIDEADRFIVQDSKARYPIAQAMRTLSEEGRAFFVLAGFWHLYAAAFMNPNNPLRNFGELIRLEPLERDAARDLATRPMEALGLSYADPALVDLVLDETGCRAHLVACVCRVILEGIGAEDRTITREAVEAALYENRALVDEFKHWRRDPLGRAAVRAALMADPVNRGGLRVRLAEAGLEVSTEVLFATLDKLELGYLLVPDANGMLHCPVPLLKRFIEREEDFVEGLRQDVLDYRASSAA